MQRAAHATDGEQLFVSELELVERVIAFVCSRNRLSADEADEFGSHVKLKLVEQNYAVLRKFEGRSSLKTYLSIVIQRLFLDYRISAWGKWRPSAEARRLGPIALQLEVLLARDGRSFEEACEILKSRHRVDLPREALEQMAARLPVRMKRRIEGDAALARLAAENAAADRLVGEHERQRTADRVSEAIAGHAKQLDVQDRVILAMRFLDGRTVAEIASTLRLEQKPLYRRLDMLLAGLRRAIEAKGISAADVMEMFESAAVNVDLGSPGSPAPTPRQTLATGARKW